MKPATTIRVTQAAILRLPGIHRLRTCINSVPSYLRPRWKWILRRFLDRWFLLPCTIEHKNGAKYRLDKDRIADQILCDLHDVYAPLFFPEDLCEVPDGEYILDLGAHHGTYAVTALYRFPNARIISVEPDPTAVASLQEHLKLNGLSDRAEVHACGIGPGEMEAMLEQSDDGSWGNKVVTGPTAAPVVSIRLQRLASILQGRRPFLVKCNCEGGEFHAIPQLFELGMRPQFIILLMHPDEGDAQFLLQSVYKAGYSITPVQTSVSHPRYVCRLVSSGA